jgi:hypothetical protein
LLFSCRETLFEVLDDALGGMAMMEDPQELSFRRVRGAQLILVENNKDLPLIASTPGWFHFFCNDSLTF